MLQGRLSNGRSVCGRTGTVVQDSGMITGTVGWDSRSLGSQAVIIG